MRELSIGTLFTRLQLNMNKIIILIGALVILGSTGESSAQTSLFERFRSKTRIERCSIFGEFLRAQRGQEGAWRMRPCVGICEGGRMVRRR